jgi:hypothetical protein
MNNMMNLGINMQDYQNPNVVDQVLAGNANTTQEQLNELSKALEAQEITGMQTLNSTTASGAPLKVESLDKTLKLITFKESEIMLWKKVPKLPAYNTVEEFNQLTSYGAERGGFVVEGELPNEEDSTYVRRAQLVKFLGVTKSVTHPMTLVNTMIGSVIDREVKNGSLWILRKVDRAIARANSAIIPEEFNGLYAQHFSTDYADKNAYYNDNPSVVDLRGDYLKEIHLEAANEGIVENHGFGSDFFAPPKVLSTFVKNFYGNKLIAPNSDQVAAGVMGQRVVAFDSQYGRVNLNYDIFLNKENKKTSTTAATSVLAPGAVVAISATPVAPTAANSLWGAGDAGNYYYAVCPINRFGEGAITVLNPGGVAAILAGGAVDLAFTPAGGANPATGFIIYRSTKAPVSVASTTFWPLFTISAAERTAGYDGGAGNVVRDVNRILPNTDQAFLIQNDEECYAFRQLAPLMKMDLAIISPAVRFMVLLYGTMLLFAPKKMTRLINIGL